MVLLGGRPRKKHEREVYPTLQAVNDTPGFNEGFDRRYLMPVLKAPSAL